MYIIIATWNILFVGMMWTSWSKWNKFGNQLHKDCQAWVLKIIPCGEGINRTEAQTKFWGRYFSLRCQGTNPEAELLVCSWKYREEGLLLEMTGIAKEQRCLEFPLIQQLNSVPIIYECHSRLQNSQQRSLSSWGLLRRWPVIANSSHCSCSDGRRAGKRAGKGIEPSLRLEISGSFVWGVASWSRTKMFQYRARTVACKAI